ncbi:hypothetical protein J4Q44_G00058110 [Coregonus suidteri]|uniref:Uncharacterized protein n=1 Tax=Coregonus suidteri TaxID=861788 RepID=A0AAN8MBM7_9TELE
MGSGLTERSLAVTHLSEAEDLFWQLPTTTAYKLLFYIIEPARQQPILYCSIKKLLRRLT